MCSPRSQNAQSDEPHTDQLRRVRGPPRPTPPPDPPASRERDPRRPEARPPSHPCHDHRSPSMIPNEYTLRTLAAQLPTRIGAARRSEEHTSELQSRFDLVCRLLLET